MTTTAAIVLAAGGSRRLGSPKQLVDLDGRPLLERVVEMVAGWPVGTVAVVLGSSAEDVLEDVDLGPAVALINEDWSEGLASSLRVGFDYLSREPQWERAFVALGDQPFVPDDVPRGLLAAADASTRPAIVPVYRYERGNPVLFARSLWSRLMALSGDVGASDLLKAHPEWVEEVRFSAAAPRDVDTRADVADLQAGSVRRNGRIR